MSVPTYDNPNSPQFERSGDYSFNQGKAAYNNQQYQQAWQHFHQAKHDYSRCYQEMLRLGDRGAANVKNKYNNALQWMNVCR